MLLPRGEAFGARQVDLLDHSGGGDMARTDSLTDPPPGPVQPVLQRLQLTRVAMPGHNGDEAPVALDGAHIREIA